MLAFPVERSIKMSLENSILLEPQETFIEAWHDCYLSDNKITGFICTMSLKNKKHIFYGLNDLEFLLREADKHKKDIYLSLNAFEHGTRTTRNLKQIRNIGIDVDCYKLNISVEDAVKEIHKLIAQLKIPNPNLLIYSGRGVQLVYSISGGASPKMAYLSQYITTQYIAQLKHLGSDSVSDVTRVLRLPYSINSRNNKMVDVKIWRTMEYDLQELYSYCTPLEKRRKPHKRQRAELVTLPNNKSLKNLYSLNTARKNDLEALVALRNGNIEKRNVLTYVYGYTVALLLKNKAQTLSFSHQLNDKLIEPQKKKEVDRTAGNAYDDAMQFFDEFAKRGFKMWYKQSDGIKRPMKSETIIDQLDITSSEMAQFETIINKETSYSRKVQKRRKQGIQKREDYLEVQKEQTENKLWQLRQAMERYPNAKRKELADMLGVSGPRITQLKKQLEKSKWSVL